MDRDRVATDRPSAGAAGRGCADAGSRRAGCSRRRAGDGGRGRPAAPARSGTAGRSARRWPAGCARSRRLRRCWRCPGPAPMAQVAPSHRQFVEMVVGDRPGAADQGADVQVVLQVRADAGMVELAPRCRARAGGRPGRCPESISNCGELIAPPASSTWPASMRSVPRPCAQICTPTARPRSISTRSTSAPVRTCRFARSRAGCRKPVAVEQRAPSRWVTWYRPKPSCCAPLKSSLRGWPALMPASISAAESALWWRRSDTPSGPPVPCSALPPRAVVLAVQEPWQHLPPAPARVAGGLGPAVVVAGDAADVAHRVDRAGAAQGLAARPPQPALRAGAARARCGSPS